MKLKDVTTLGIQRIIEPVEWTGFHECGSCGEVEASQYPSGWLPPTVW